VGKGNAVECMKCEVVVMYFLFDRQSICRILKGQVPSSTDSTSTVYDIQVKYGVFTFLL